MASLRELFFIGISIMLCSELRAQPKANFVANPTKGCSPATINFTNQSTGKSLTYLWDLGNGNTSALKDPQAIYYNPGLYTIKLTVTDNTGKVDSFKRVKYLEIFRNPVADFDAQYLKGCAPFDPVLTDKSTRGSGIINQWTWDYSDGSVITNKSPTHSYYQEGVYDISLIVKDVNGCQSKTSKKQYITVSGTPVVLFNADRTAACSAPLTVNFSNKSTGLKSSDQFEWDFGDGTFSTDKNPKKIYSSLGNYTVTLKIKSANGCVTSTQLKDYISIAKLKVAFSSTNQSPCLNEAVTFTNTTTPAGFTVNCFWDFGDGYSGKGKTVSHQYSATGNYSVKLRVSMSDGSCLDSITYTNSISVGKKPTSRFTISDTILCSKGMTDTLIDKSIGASSHSWLLNDNFVSNKAGTVIKLNKVGNYTVSLISGNGSCFDTLNKNILVDSIQPKIDLSPKKGCKPLKVTFRDFTQSLDSITKRFWDLGDGSFEVADSFEYTYDQEGIYIVKLTITTLQGCAASVLDTVWVGAKMKPTFNYKSTKCNSDSIQIVSAGNKIGGVVDQWKWFIDSTKIGTGRILHYKVRLRPNTYNLKLVAYNNGCPDTVVVKDALKVLPPLVGYTTIFDSCTKYPYIFINASESADQIGWVLSNDSIVLNQDSLFVRNDSDLWPVKFWGKNFNSGCTDTIKVDFDRYRYYRFVAFSWTGDLCAPSTIKFTNNSYDYTKYKWNWGDGTSDLSSSSPIFKKYIQPGKYNIKLLAETPNGCKDSVSQSFSITGPKVEYKIAPLTGCAPLEVSLINKTTSVGLKNKYWRINDTIKIPVTSDTMLYTFKAPGPYANKTNSVSLVIDDQSGCSGIGTDTVKVDGLRFHFKVNALATCDFPILSINPVFEEKGIDVKNLVCLWDYGDGRQFTGSAVNYIYKNEGTYKLSLKVLDQNGCITQQDTLISNNVKTIRAELLADKLEANCPPLRVNFISKSKDNFGTITSYLWDFGDGSTSGLQNPSHLYLTAGKFTVKLKVTNDFNCSDELIYKDLILIDGPVGSFSFDKKEGCTPLFVNFNSSTLNTFKMEWDMGDGKIIIDSTKAGHLYDRVGNYIPLLVLSDSFGCKYTLPPIDTIKVYPIPIAGFNYTTPCVNQLVYFKNNSDPVSGTQLKCIWDFGDGDTSTQLEPSHIFKSKGSFDVRLRVKNIGNCEDEIVKKVIIKNTSAGFKPGKLFYCAGQLPQLLNTSISDTSFRNWSWFLNDSLLSKKSKPNLPKLLPGVYKVTLAVEDNFGCRDTLVQKNGILIGDTFPPTPPFIYRVSVVNDNSVVLDYSGYRSFDFKEYSIYSLNSSGTYSKQLSTSVMADTSKVIGLLNTLHNVYCYKVTSSNLCGFESSISQALEHCTVETKAKGEVRKIIVTWNAYTGWPVINYEVFREEIGEKGRYNYLGTVNGNKLDYVDTNVFCKIDHFYKIKAIENGGNNQISWSDTAAAKPQYLNAVPPNNMIRATVDFDKEITIEWTGSGSPRVPIQEYVLEKSEDGVHYKWYKSFTPKEFSFTDKAVGVDDMSYFYRTYAIDTCALKSNMVNFAKSILLTADTNREERPFVTWSAYRGWDEGVDQYEVQRKKTDGTFVTIGNVNETDSMLVDNITDLNGHPFYCYRVIGYKNTVTGQKQIISISNEDCAPVRSRIFAANAFTVNGDHINETFDIKGLYIKDYTISIFNRWGEKVFESNDMNVDWDGYYKGEFAQMDAYIWIIKAIGVDGINWPLKGTVTLIR